VYYFDDLESEQFMKDFSPEAYKAYNSIKPTAYKSDLWRYCILYKYGGCYSDISHITLKNFDYINGNEELLIPYEKNTLSGYHNGLMCIKPKHPLMLACVNKCIENINNKYYGIHPWDITGPAMLHKEYLRYKIPTKIFYYHAGDNSKITNDSGELLIHTKMPKYYALFYDSKQRIYYQCMYKKKDVYY
jgi:mannosyltransferase OCH1-like enzyme